MTSTKIEQIASSEGLFLRKINISKKFRELNVPGSQKYCGDREYVVGKNHEWKRADMTVSEKRKQYHDTKRQKRQSIRQLKRA
jgi:hypothetical protein